MIVLIALAGAVYIMIGLAVCGFVGLDFFMDLPVFLATTVLWPLCIVLFIFITVCAGPVRLGKKLADKYYDTVNNFFNKILDN